MRRCLHTVCAVLALSILFGCSSEPGRRQLDEGVRALTSGEYVLAKTWFGNTINETTDAEIKKRALNFLGIASWHLNEIQTAVDSFDAAREIDPEYPAPCYNLALVALETGDSRRSVELMEDAAMLDSSIARGLEYLAFSYMRNHRWADARRIYLDAIEKTKPSARLLTAAGRAEFQLERYRDAASYWQEALDIDKKYPPAVFNLAVFKLVIDDSREEGLDLLQRYAELAGPEQRANQIAALKEISKHSPGDAADERTETDNDEDAGDILELAREKRRSGSSDTALNLCLQEAIRAKRVGDELRQLEALQTAAEICFDSARAHYVLGRYHLERGEIDKATRSLRQAVAIKPESATTQTAFAECSIAAENFDAALVSLRKALRIDTNNMESLWMLATLYDKHIQDAEAALKSYRKFARLFPGDPRVIEAQTRIGKLRRQVEALQSAADGERDRDARAAGEDKRPSNSAAREFRLGLQAQKSEQWKKAAEHFRAAVGIEPDMLRGWFNLGVANGILERDPGAVRAYRKVLSLQPRHSSARFNLALIFYNDENYGDAVRELRRILAHEPSHAKAHFLLGVIYSSKDVDIPRAKQHYRRFLRLRPDDRNAPVIRKWLGRH